MKDKIALFDFCETLADFQTFDPFMEYVLEKEHVGGFLLKNRIFKLFSYILSKVKPGFYLYKRWLISSTKGLKLETMQQRGKEYYNTVVKPRLIKDVINELQQCKAEGMKIGIISAGCNLYIDVFAEQFAVDYVVTNNFAFDKGVCKGMLANEDCCRSHKLTMWAEYKNEHDINGEEIVGYSDSSTDIPMLSICKEKVAISYRTHQLWVTKGYREIIWK